MFGARSGEPLILMMKSGRRKKMLCLGLGSMGPLWTPIYEIGPVSSEKAAAVISESFGAIGTLQ